ncbi:hypothetical protein GCM10025786_36490 [Nocardioides caeni]
MTRRDRPVRGIGQDPDRFGSGLGREPAPLAPSLSLPDLAALERVLRIGVQEATAHRLDTTAAISVLGRIRALQARGARVSGAEPRELLSLREAARRAGVSESTARGWVTTRGLEPIGRCGGRLLWTAEDVVEAAERLGR